MNNKTYKFKAVIKKNPDMDAAYIEIPFDVEKEFGNKKDIRSQINKQANDTIDVTIKEREYLK